MMKRTTFLNGTAFEAEPQFRGVRITPTGADGTAEFGELLASCGCLVAYRRPAGSIWWQPGAAHLCQQHGLDED